MGGDTSAKPDKLTEDHREKHGLYLARHILNDYGTRAIDGRSSVGKAVRAWTAELIESLPKSDRSRRTERPLNCGAETAGSGCLAAQAAADGPMMPCLEPGCPVMVERGRCPRHKRREQRRYNASRPSPARQGYGRDWREASRRYLAAHPICENCSQRKSRLTDHIVPIKRGGARMDPANWQALCVHCHEAKKARERRGSVGA